MISVLNNKYQKDQVLSSLNFIKQSDQVFSASLSQEDLEKFNFTSLDTNFDLSVSSAFKNLPNISCLGICSFDIEIFNEMSSKTEVIRLKDVRVIDSPIDIIVGLPDIRTFDLLRKCHDQIIDDTTVHRIHDPEEDVDSFVENDLWLRVNMICAMGEDSPPSSQDEENATPVGSRRQFDPAYS